MLTNIVVFSQPMKLSNTLKKLPMPGKKEVYDVED
jgi:hypothetical protein